MSAPPTPPPYDHLGQGYAARRQPDPRIQAALVAALGPAQSILNVGAGSGSYEPTDRRLVAVEPSAVMIAQRPSGSPPVVQAVAEALPFAKDAFDASLAILTIHHWSDPERGLREVQRVTRERVVFLTWDPLAGQPFWLVERYLPELGVLDRERFASTARIASILGSLEMRPLPLPADCTDGFLGAYWQRPEAYLNDTVRNSISTFHLLDAALVDQRLELLAQDLATGAWDRLYGDLRRVSTLDVGYRILTAQLS